MSDAVIPVAATPDELRKFYPPQALARGVEGTAIIDCTVDVDYTVGKSCMIMVEDPIGSGLGVATIKLVKAEVKLAAPADGAPLAHPTRQKFSVTWKVQ